MRALVLAVAAGLGAAAVATAQQTPPPTIQSDGGCAAVLHVSWDVSSLPEATRVAWRLRYAAAPGILASGLWDGPSGTETIDLRSYGPALNGTTYEVAIRAKRDDNSNVAQWSEPATFGTDVPAGTVEVAQTSEPYVVHVTGAPLAPAVDCAGEYRYEVAAQPFTVTDGDEPGQLETGPLDTTDGTTVSLTQYQVDEVWIRTYARGPGGFDVGRRSDAATITLGLGGLAVEVVEADPCGEPGPAAGATVAFSGPVEESHPTETDGGTGLVPLPPGTYTLVATTAAGCASEPVTVEVAPGQNSTAEIEVECPPFPDVDLAVELAAPAADSLFSGSAYPWDVVVTNVDERPAPRREVRLLRSRPPPEGDVLIFYKPVFVGEAVVPAGLCPGQEWRTVFTDAPQVGEWRYVASLPGRDAQEANDEDEAGATVIGRADLNPDLEQSHLTLPPGGTMTYTVVVENEGDAVAEDVVVKNELPADLDFLSAQGTGGFSCDRTGTTVRCAGATLTPGWTATIEIKAQLPLAATAGHSLVFGTLVDPDDAIAESDEYDNGAGAFAQTGEATTVDHVVPMIHAMAVARERGFLFEAVATRFEDQGRCRILQDGWFLGTTSTDDGFTCEFRFFRSPTGARGGGGLARGWTIVAVRIDPPPESVEFRFVDAPALETDDPSFVIETVHPINCPRLSPLCWEHPDGLGGRVVSITLRGPQGINWPGAFPALRGR